MGPATGNANIFCQSFCPRLSQLCFATIPNRLGSACTFLGCFVLMSPDVSDIFILGSFFSEGLRRNIGALTSRLITLRSAFGHLALWARHPAPLLRVWFSKPAGVLLCYHSSGGSGFRVSTVNLESLEALQGALVPKF